MFGFINVYKPKGKTSHDIVAILRRITKVKQIGHTGTLDPFAEGVLPVCIGKATRLIEYLEDDKVYIGRVQFGNSTTTYDIEGEEVNVSDKRISRQEVESALEQFRGEINQIPPMYSAIKVKGKKLYEYARKGEEIQVEPRKVTINKLELVSFDEENQTADLLIECSKGTYIRSIANDLGKVTGCFGHLVKLVRTKAGRFEIDKAVSLEDLQTIETVQSKIICPLEYLNYPKYELNETEVEKISHGVGIDVDLPDGVAVLTTQNKLAAMVVVEKKRAKIQKVFI